MATNPASARRLLRRRVAHAWLYGYCARCGRSHGTIACPEPMQEDEQPEDEQPNGNDRGWADRGAPWNF